MKPLMALIAFSSLLLIVGGASYFINSASLPGEILLRAEQERESGDHAREAEWLRRYLLLKPNDYQVQALLALAVDSSLGKSDRELESSLSFLASQRLEIALQLADMLEQQELVLIRRRLADRYVECSEFVFSTAMLESDGAVQDSLLTESLVFLEKAAQKVSDNLQGQVDSTAVTQIVDEKTETEPEEDATLSRQIALRRAITEQMFNSKVLLESRGECSPVISLEGKEIAASMRQCKEWFDGTLRQAVSRDPVDYKFFRFLLARLDNQKFPWRSDSVSAGWFSQSWSLVPKEILTRLSEEETSQSRLLEFAIREIQSRRLENPIDYEIEWIQAGDDALAVLSSEASTVSGGAIDSDSLFWERKLLAAAWSKVSELDDEHQDRWWAQLNDSLRDKNENLLQQLCLERAQRFVRKQEADKAMGCWRQATQLRGEFSLSAWAALADQALLKCEEGKALQSLTTEASLAECDRVLRSYGDTAREERIKLRDRNLSVTNYWSKNRASYLSFHELQLDVFKQRMGWLSGIRGSSLITFRKLLGRRLESGLPIAMVSDALKPLIDTLRRNGHYEAAASIFEDVLISSPGSGRLRNQCADAWADAGNTKRARYILRSGTDKIGPDGRAKLLFLDFMTWMKGDRKPASLSTISERAESLRKEYQASGSAVSDSESTRTGELISEFIQVMTPPDGVAFESHSRDVSVQEHVLAMALDNLNNAWFYGIACELVRFADPEQQPTLRKTIEEQKDLGTLAFQIQQAKAVAARGDYLLAVKQTLELARENPGQEATLKQWAAQLAADVAGTKAGLDILESISEESRNHLTIFRMAIAEIDLVREARILGESVAASKIERKYEERLSEMEADNSVMEHQLAFLKIYKKHQELAAIADGIERTESYGKLIAELALILGERPWWTPAHALMGRLNQALRKHQLAEKHLTLARESGDDSIATLRRLQQTLVVQGKQEPASELQRRVSMISGILRRNWAIYLGTDQRLKPPGAKLSYSRAIACRHRTQDAWLLWANRASDLCTTQLPYDQYAELTEQASFALRKAMDCQQGFSLPVIQMEFRLARLKTDQRRIAEIIAKLQKQSESNAEACDLLTSCYLSLGRIGSACDSLNHACELKLSTGRLYKLAECYSSIGRDQAAKNCLERAVALNADPRGSRRALALFHIEKATKSEALGKLRSLYSTGEISNECVFDFATLAAKNFGPEGVREGLGRLRALADRCPETAEQVCRLSLRLSSEAINNADQQDETVPQDLMAVFRESHTKLVESGWQTEQDLRIYAEAWMCDSMQPSEEEYSNLISALEAFPQCEFLLLKAKLRFANQNREKEGFDQDRIKRLVSSWRNSVVESRRMPDQLASLLASAELYRVGLMDPAYDLFRESFHKRQRNAVAYVDLLGEMKLYEEQVRICDFVLTQNLEEGFVAEFARACNQSVAANPSTGAIPFKDKLLKRFPDNVDVLQFAVTMHFERGEFDDAVRLLFQLDRLAPGRPLVLNNLAYCLSELPGRLDDAFSLATRAHEIAPHDPTVMDTLAVIQMKKGDVKSAVSLIRNAMMLKKEPRYLFHLLMAYEKTGETAKYEETLALLNQIELDPSGLAKSEQEGYAKRFL